MLKNHFSSYLIFKLMYNFMNFSKFFGILTEDSLAFLGKNVEKHHKNPDLCLDLCSFEWNKVFLVLYAFIVGYYC